MSNMTCMTQAYIIVMGKVDCMRSRDVTRSIFLVIKLFQSTFETAHLGFKGPLK